jgi:hypothetical protein
VKERTRTVLKYSRTLAGEPTLRPRASFPFFLNHVSHTQTRSPWAPSCPAHAWCDSHGMYSRLPCNPALVDPLTFAFISMCYTTQMFFFFAMIIRLFSLRPYRHPQHFKSATTGVATKTMRNELSSLVKSVADPTNKRVSGAKFTCRSFCLSYDALLGLRS